MQYAVTLLNTLKKLGELLQYYIFPATIFYGKQTPNTLTWPTDWLDPLLNYAWYYLLVPLSVCIVP